MRKLNIRQIAIMIILVIVVLFAAYDLFISQPASKKAKIEAKPEEITTFINSITTNVLRDNVAGVDSYIIKKAEMDWSKNPFWSRSEYREFAGKEAGGGLASKIVYSGYVDAGRKRMAIINGFEYEIGEALEVEGYILKNVTPSKVVIFNRDTGSELIIPIQE